MTSYVQCCRIKMVGQARQWKKHVKPVRHGA